MTLLRQAAHRALVRERAGSIETGDLAGEVYLRLATGQDLAIDDMVHLKRLVARVTRHVLVDRARRRGAARRGADPVRVTYSERGLAEAGLDLDVLTLHVLLERLGQLDSRAAEIVQMRVFGGASAREVAEALEVSRATVQSDWAFALTWLRKQLAAGPTDDG